MYGENHCWMSDIKLCMVRCHINFSLLCYGEDAFVSWGFIFLFILSLFVFFGDPKLFISCFRGFSQAAHRMERYAGAVSH